METRKIDIRKVLPNEGQIPGLPSNPRQWKKAEMDLLKKSLQETPELFEARGILVYPLDGNFVVLGGNMRLAASKALKLKEVPCIVLPPDLSADKLKEIVIKDNGAFGAWDYDNLANEWSDLPLTEWGVPAWDVDKMPAVNEKATEDDFDETKDEVPTRCAKGDIWILGDHRLMCGDSTKAEDIARLLDGEKADCWLTDPPYNVNYEGRTKDALKIQNDSMDDEHFRAFLVDCYAAADQNMKPGATFYIWHADSEGFNFRYAARSCNWKVRECLIWKKNSLVLGRQDYQWQHEPCLYGWKDGAGHKWYNDRKQTTILEFNKPQRNGDHPTMKPVELFGYQMSNSTQKGDLVLDSFAGSGTTIVAAEQLGRRAMVLELDPHYCDVIIARWEKLTGKTAVKA